MLYPLRGFCEGRDSMEIQQLAIGNGRQMAISKAIKPKANNRELNESVLLELCFDIHLSAANL
jgi:hypothetical protein